MTSISRGCLIALAAVAGLSATATPAMAQCQRDLSVYAGAVIGDYDENGDAAELLGFASSVDNSSCSVEEHSYSTSVCATRVDNGVPVFCGESESLYAEGSSMVDVGVLLNVLSRSTLFCPWFMDVHEEEDEVAGVQILPIPDGETSQFVQWSEEPWRTRGEYRMTLQGGAGESFTGRQIIEEQLAGGDNCHQGQTGSPPSPFDVGGLTGLVLVFVYNDNQWEWDKMGWREDAVEFYQQFRILPCGVYVAQGMKINVGPGQFRQYQVNQVEWEIKANSVTTVRAPDANAERQWPE